MLGLATMSGAWDLGPHVNQPLFATIDLRAMIEGFNFVPLRFFFNHFKKKIKFKGNTTLFSVKVCLVLFVIELRGK